MIWGKGKGAFLMRFAIVSIFAATICFAADVSSTAASVTFHKDVESILQKNCQSCHRPGQIAPMSFLSYDSVRPWARAMKAAVLSRKMPPWFADPKYGHFSNDRALKQKDIDTIAAWVDGGAKEGDAKDAPAAVNWPKDGWEIQPDYVVKGPEYSVPAKGILEWTNVVVPSGLTKDTWITSLEIKPSEYSVTHHICISFVQHTPGVKYNEPVWVDKERDASGSAPPRAAGVRNELPGAAGVAKTERELIAARLNPGGSEGCYVPGMQSIDYRLYGAAKLVPANTDIVFQLHYSTTGTPKVDRPQVGFTLAKEMPQRRFISYTAQPSVGSDGSVFKIPANDPKWASPPAEIFFNEDARLVWMMPHMHLRGKDMTYNLEYPTGEKQIVLNVPNYDFNWQLGYYTDVKIPKGTKMRVDAHFDNSPNNKFNPAPDRPVYWGDQTWEEMMAPFFGVVVDVKRDPEKVVTVKGGRVRGA
jgi:mono/diheme cytochrome c family protein